jgi:hypothetical protein
MYEQVKGTDDTVVHIEKYIGTNGPPTGTAFWVTLAAGNVFPDELLRLTAGRDLSAPPHSLSTSNSFSSYPPPCLLTLSENLKNRGIDVWRAHLDNVYDPLNSIPKDQNTPYVPGYVTLLRLLVSSPAEDVLSSAFLAKFTRDLKRSKWLDDMTLNLAFPAQGSGKPVLGTSIAEVITCLSSMIHSVLSKVNPVAFARYNIEDDVLPTLCFTLTLFVSLSLSLSLCSAIVCKISLI